MISLVSIIYALIQVLTVNEKGEYDTVKIRIIASVITVD